MQQNNFTLPNVITSLRLAMVPVILFFAVTRQLDYFKWLLLIALLSDILDGWIARTFHQETPLGSRLDALADTLLYVVAVFAIFVFAMDFLKAHWLPVSVVLGLYLAEKIKTFIKFGQFFNSFHNYSAKAMGYAQGIFIVSLFFWGYQPVLFYLAMGIGCVANIEDMIISSLVETYEHDTRGLYWVLKKRKPVK